MQGATLTYLNARQQPVASFELDRPETIVGRTPLGMHYRSEGVDVMARHATFQVRRGETLFVGIVSDFNMCRQHFCIRRAIAASGEAVYFVQDLNSRCGTRVNSTLIGAAVVQLKDGDLIACSSRFVFNLVHANREPAVMGAETAQQIPDQKNTNQLDKGDV
jgi:hypothetical protein